MAELMLVNPRRRRHRRKRVTRLRRNPRRHMTAKQLEYFGPRKRRSHRRRRSVALAEPRPAARRSHRRARRSYRHRARAGLANLRSMNLKSLMNSTLIPAGVGAAGALGLDVALGFASPHLPAFLNNGVMKTVTRVAGAVGIGYVAGAIAGKRFGEEAMAGAITVTLYDLLKGMVKSAVPSLPLSGTGWVSPAYQVGAYVGTDSAFAHPGLSAYVGSDFVYDGIRDPSLSGYDYDY